MDDIFGKVKESTAKVKDEAEKLTNIAVKKTKDAIEQTKYSYTLSGIEKKINEILADLGLKIYEEYENGIDFGDEIKDKCDQIKALKEDIKEIKEKMATLKKSVVCRECGAIVSDDSIFCPKCGVRINDWLFYIMNS